MKIKNIKSNETKKLKEEIEANEKEIISMASDREELKFVADYYAMRAEKYGVLNGLAQSKNVFLITDTLSWLMVSIFAVHRASPAVLLAMFKSSSDRLE